MKSAIFFFTAAATAATVGDRSVIVFGGEPTPITKVPWQVEYDISGEFECGGTIISKRYVITAGHCTSGATAPQLTIRAGSDMLGKGTVYKVAEVHAHPRMQLVGTPDFDFAILKLDRDIVFSDSVKAIGIANAPAAAGANGLLSGWGTTKEGTPKSLQSVQIPVISRGKCQDLANAYKDTVTERFLCTLPPGGGKGPCFGDSGGPLVINGKLSGVVSGGEKCAGAAEPGMFTDVGDKDIRDFIRQVTGI